MPIPLQEIAEALNMPPKMLRKEGIKAFLERELRWIRVEILSVCQKYGVSSWEGMNELISQDKVEEGKILEDFQRAVLYDQVDGDDGRTSRSISSMRIDRFGCSKLIPGAGTRLCLISGRTCLW